MATDLKAHQASMTACKHCPRTTPLDEEKARVCGWRFYDGPTIGGGHLVDVICPVCGGAKPEDPEDPEPGWDVECLTCDWSALDEWESGDEPIGTAKEAQRTAYDHRCEPAFRFKDPAGKWYFDHDREFMDMVYPPRPKAVPDAPAH